MFDDEGSVPFALGPGIGTSPAAGMSAEKFMKLAGVTGLNHELPPFWVRLDLLEPAFDPDGTGGGPINSCCSCADDGASCIARSTGLGVLLLPLECSGDGLVVVVVVEPVVGVIAENGTTPYPDVGPKNGLVVVLLLPPLPMLELRPGAFFFRTAESGVGLRSGLGRAFFPPAPRFPLPAPVLCPASVGPRRGDMLLWDVGE